MNRREFITLFGGAVAWPLAARAQEAVQMKHIGVLMGRSESDREGQAFVAAFREELQKLGWAEGRNIRIDYRWATPGDAESIQRVANELVALQPDLVLAQNTPNTAALAQQTRNIPIVFATVSDPVGSGFVANFPRPGGNVTGFTNIEPTTAGKWLELLKEIAPHVARVAFLCNPATAPYEYYLSSFKAAARSFAVEAIAAPVRDRSELEPVITALARAPNGGLVLMTDNIAKRSHRWRFVIVSLPSIHIVPSLKPAAFYPMEMTRTIIFGARRPMSTASSKAQSRASFPSRRRSSSIWRSTSKPPRRSASMCRLRSSPAPTR
jgi:putative tryptophan/tyrosine transport system substrate-binding protein